MENSQLIMHLCLPESRVLFAYSNREYTHIGVDSSISIVFDLHSNWHRSVFSTLHVKCKTLLPLFLDIEFRIRQTYTEMQPSHLHPHGCTASCVPYGRTNCKVTCQEFHFFPFCILENFNQTTVTAAACVPEKHFNVYIKFPERRILLVSSENIFNYSTFSGKVSTNLCTEMQFEIKFATFQFGHASLPSRTLLKNILNGKLIDLASRSVDSNLS